jgi:hypothetical protein
MKKVAISILLVSTLSWAAPKPEEYPINVHVISSHWVMEPTNIGPAGFQRINVIINGKKYELEALCGNTILNTRTGVPVLALGDYKAKLVHDEHKPTYESSQVYEFLFPDNKTEKFLVVGQAE